ncbi:hopanoid biosynthesis-associated protein HpnK [Nostoc sp. FACHB-110]|uniref:hopanoid biosynthesis-associated protein HpnK n=1 Tax=Nostoc sp. FACHB-110 TaxID=2692834 RepID=UPI001685819B|nr:hopanoid biosynthesis-associated protein HpnK [Nostoc sp. FACHB-110]MBD2439540.1 hopanoid biosynthesis-associated protein HpnK [Nostoc sp. FACHB-110]
MNPPENLHSPRRFAIINGDDFGFSRGVNQAIIKAHKQGILTSTSLMVTGEAAEEAIALAQQHPDLAVGLHLVLVCGHSVLPPEQIPHLVDAQGNFPNSSVLAGLRYQFQSAARAELRQEIRAQLSKFQASGLPLSHVDGHLHLHVHPVVLQILVELAPEFGIRFIRLPSEELGKTLKLNRQALLTKLIWSGVFAQLRRYGETLLTSHGINFSDKVYGLLQTGNVTEKYLLGLIPQIGSNLIEIYCHPAQVQAGEALNGPPASGTTELAALLSHKVRKLLIANNFELTNYQKLAALGHSESIFF